MDCKILVSNGGSFRQIVPGRSQTGKASEQVFWTIPEWGKLPQANPDRFLKPVRI